SCRVFDPAADAAGSPWTRYSERHRCTVHGRRIAMSLPRGCMNHVTQPAPSSGDLPDVMRAIRARTPARILVGRAGPAYRTPTAPRPRHVHAAAVDAVHAELDLHRDFGDEFISRWGLFEVRTHARDKTEYLMRPDHGRRLDDPARETIARQCPRSADVQVVVGD